MPALTIRQEQPDDHDAVAAVVEAAFKSPAEALLVERLRASPEFVPELSLVAEVDGRVVGHVLVSYATLRDGDVDRRVASLAPLAVAPDHERRGIGSALVRAVLAETAGRGEPFVVLQGSPAYYGRLGFEPAADHGIEMSLPSWAAPEAAQVHRLGRTGALPTGLVVLPPAFDDLGEH